MDTTFGEKVEAFNKSLRFEGRLPEGIGVMNPFDGNRAACDASRVFYQKFYADKRMRSIILGINPGRFGAGITGVPFTDPVRLLSKCGIANNAFPHVREPSSEFVYDVIDAYGGPEEFYARWYINSVCPLGFYRMGEGGRRVNYNYYDSAALQRLALPFIVSTLARQLDLGVKRHACICLGTGKNYAFLSRLNQEHGFFENIYPVEHPRYIIQYKSRERGKYVEKYLEALERAAGSL